MTFRLFHRSPVRLRCATSSMITSSLSSVGLIISEYWPSTSTFVDWLGSRASSIQTRILSRSSSLNGPPMTMSGSDRHFTYLLWFNGHHFNVRAEYPDGRHE